MTNQTSAVSERKGTMLTNVYRGVLLLLGVMMILSSEMRANSRK